MIKINLAPPRERRRFSITLPSFNLGWLFGILAVAGIALIGGWWWMLGTERARLEGEVSIATKQLDTLKAAIAEGNKFKAERDDLERRVAAIEELTKNQPKQVYFLESVAEAVPRDLWLSSATEREKVLRFSGTAFSSTSVADFMANLRSSGKFKLVDLVVARQDIGKVPRLITFEITCRFEI